jgi:hypothetical protein
MSAMEQHETRWQRFALEIASGASIAKASKATAVSRSTGYRWMDEPAVMALIDKAREDLYRDYINKANGLAMKALETLVNNISNPRIALEFWKAHQGWLLADLLNRIKDIEAPQSDFN